MSTYLRKRQNKFFCERQKEPIIFLSTDLTLTAAQIIEIYGARFSIELATTVS